MKFKFLLVFVFFPLILKAQMVWENNSLGIKYQYGFVWTNHPFINYLIKDNVKGIEISFRHQGDGKQLWQQLFGYPNYGINFCTSTLGNDQVFGRMYAIYPFFNCDFLKRKHFALGYQLAGGLGYITKKFGVNDSYMDVLIGSHFNCYVDLSLQSKFILNHNYQITNTLSFKHLSNGGTNEPNYGINYILYSVGLNLPISKQKAFVVDTVPPFKRSIEYDFATAFGMKQSKSYFAQKHYLASSLIFDVKKHFGYRFATGIGADLFYDGAVKKVENTSNNFDCLSTGIHLNQELIINRLSVGLNEGIYLIKDDTKTKIIYSRFIARYKVSQHLYTHFAVKSHLFVADFLEWGVGYYFNSNQR